MKKMPWFRMYSEAVDDEKLRLLAFEDRWHFVAILCCKCSGVLDSKDPLLRRKMAVKLGLGIRELDEVARRLSEVGLIDFETMQPLHWEERQFQSDRSTDRVKAYRERMKRGGNVSVTAQDTETETDTDTEKHMSSEASSDCGAVPASRKQSGYTTEFEQAWKQYPSRPGNSKADAFKAWNARLKAGATADQMLAGVMRYAAYCAAERTEPRYIKQAATFFGPGEHFMGDWTPTKRVSLMNNIGVDDEIPEGFQGGV